MTPCQAIKKDGKQCQNPAMNGKKYCGVHNKQYFWQRIASISVIGTILLGALAALANISQILDFIDKKLIIIPTILPTLTVTPVPSLLPTNTVIPTMTPITSGESSCYIEMKENAVFADLKEVLAVIRDGELEIEPHYLDRYIALDSGCGPLSFFTIVATTKLASGNSNNGFCVVFGPEPPQGGILENNYAFCIDGNKNWLVGSQKDGKFVPSKKNSNEILRPMGEENRLVVDNTPGGIYFSVNGKSVNFSPPTDDLKRGNYFGFGLGTSTELPKWVVTGLKVHQYDKPKGSDWQGFSRLSQQEKSSLMLVARQKQQAGLSVTNPAILNYPVATYILMDASQSMKMMNNNYYLGQVLIKMILESAPPDDMIGLGLFGEGVSVIFPPDTRILDLPYIKRVEDSIAKGFQRPAETTNYALAFQDAIHQLTQIDQRRPIPMGTNRRIVLITDGRLNNSNTQKDDLSNVYLEAKRMGIDIDVILIGDQASNEFLDMWKSLGEISVANHLYQVKSLKEVAGIVLKQYYYSHTYDNSDNSIILKAPGEYRFAVMPNVEKMAMTFTSDLKPDQPFEAYLVSPDGTKYTMYAGAMISVPQPTPGQWEIVLSGDLQEPIEVQSLFLVSLPSN